MTALDFDENKMSQFEQELVSMSEDIANKLETLTGIPSKFWIKIDKDTKQLNKDKEIITMNYGQFRCIKRDALDAFINLASLPTSTYSFVERDVLRVAEQKIDSVVKMLLAVEGNRND